MRPLYDVFFFLAVMGFITLAYKDLKTRKVDSRRNWTIQGAILGMVLLTQFNLLTYLALMLGTALFNAVVLRGYWGDGDKEVMQWALPGLAMFAGFNYAAMFLFVMALYHSGIIIVSKIVFKEVLEKRPGIPILAGAFILTTIAFYFF